VKKQTHTICSAQFVEKILQTVFADSADCSEEQIGLAYRTQYHIEDAFMQMKNPPFLGLSPVFHSTGSKIQVHAFSCVLAFAAHQPAATPTGADRRATEHQSHPRRIRRHPRSSGGLPASPRPTACRLARNFTNIL